MLTAVERQLTRYFSAMTQRVDDSIRGTIHRVDHTAEQVKSTVKDKVNQAAGVVRGVRAAIISLLHNGDRPKPPATAAGRL